MFNYYFCFGCDFIFTKWMTNVMAENLIFIQSIMYGEGFVLILLLTFLTFSYLIFKRKHATKLWNKCKSLISNYNQCKQVSQNSPRHLPLLEFAQWQYRGEGNKYLAISLPQQRKILRLRKTVRPKGLISYFKDWYMQHFHMIRVTHEKRAVYYEKLNLEYYKVLMKLIGECYVQPSEEILLKRNEINKVNKIIASSRPEYRKKKHIGYSCGSLLTDYAYLPIEWDVSQFSGPTFAVEIKPKQGWIPEPERFYQLCTYCLNQYIKLQNGEISALSYYCPMDLFSGQKSRMNTAIKSLLKMPQNNIKLFVEGGLIYGENINKNLHEAITNIFEGYTSTLNDEQITNEFCDLITNALLKQIYKSNYHACTLPAIKQSLKKSYNHLKHCDASRTALPPGCVLERILKLQELDTWGSEKLCQILREQPNYETYKEGLYNHASGVVSRAKKHPNFNFNCAKCFFHEPGHRDTETTETEIDFNLDVIVQKYIMSAIAKDCSLMLTFRRLNTSDHVNIPQRNVIQTNFGFYAFNIGVFDLYPKPLTCIFKQERKRCHFRQIYQDFKNSDL